MNRDTNRQAGEFEGREINPINVDLGTEYWLTRAGRGKSKDIFEDAGRSVEGIKRVLTHRDEDTGEYDFAGNVLSESITRRLIDRGFIVGKGKKIEQIAKEIESRYGDMTRKGIKVRFYGAGDVDTTNLTEDQLRKLEANGIATTGDGYIWINKEKIKDGDTIDFNKVVSHELTHQILGKDTEYQARYVEGTYGEHLQGIKNNGYLKDGQIIDLMMSSLTDEDRARLNKYVDGDMEFKLYIDDKLSDADRKELLEYHQKLTNDKLKFVKCVKDKGCEVVFEKGKDGKRIRVWDEEYKKGTKLLDKIIQSKKEAFITNETDPSKNFQVWNKSLNKYETILGSKAIKDTSINEKTGKVLTERYYVMIDRAQKLMLDTWDSENKRAIETEQPIYITTGHELTHVLHYFEGTHTGELGVNWTIDSKGEIYRDAWLDKNGKVDYKRPEYGQIEEYRTVGIGNTLIEKAGHIGVIGEYNKSIDDITENSLRKEHNLPLRSSYTQSGKWIKVIDKEEKNHGKNK